MSRLDRARALMARPAAWLSAEGGGYALRLGGDRRGRPLLTLDEAVFRALTEQPGLAVRPGGGWAARAAPGRAADPSPSASLDGPGRTGGLRLVTTDDGRLAPRRANLTPTAIAWLASRRDAQGRPWLTPAETAAGARLTAEAEAALKGPSLTLRWDALPRTGSGGAASVEPSQRALAAARRVEAALSACGPARAMIEAVCLRGSALQAAEHGLGLRRRSGRELLRQGLTALAAHYRIG